MVLTGATYPITHVVFIITSKNEMFFEANARLVFKIYQVGMLVAKLTS